MFCKQPDRHEPKLICGYPLPCPYHTVIIEPPDVIHVPDKIKQNISKDLINLLKQIAERIDV